MKISFDWLKDFIDITESVVDTGKVLTDTGLEVEGIESYESIPGGLEGLLVGKVVTCKPHPNADRLKLTQVDLGNGKAKPIVCGAPNVAEGQKVVVAPVGVTIYPVNNDPFTIKKVKIRGEVSEGMICAEDEFGWSSDHEGIMVLDTELPPGTPLQEVLEVAHDKVFEIGLTPNRADGASHVGVARDLRAAWHRPIRLPDVSDFKVDNHQLPIRVRVEDHQRCPRYAGVTLTGVRVGPSPAWLEHRLRAIGLAPINNVVDVTNYVLHELGQPLHAFDADQITGGEVVVKTLANGSSFITLDEVERKLTDQDLMICNAEEGMCIAGVFGGIHSGVTEKTSNVFLESAYFSPDSIRKTSMHHGLKTDAAFRFERGIDPDITLFALKRAALLIKEVTGGEISSDIVDVYPEKMSPYRVPVIWDHVDRLIGMSIPRQRIREILQDLEIAIENEQDDRFIAVVPPYRVDVTREADVIEEILRIYGYNQVPLNDRMSANFLAEFPEKDWDSWLYDLSKILSGAGYQEIVTNSLTASSLLEKLPGHRADEAVPILNYTSEDLNLMRTSMLSTGLASLAHNIKRKQRHLKFFESGKIYKKDGVNYRESYMLALYLTGEQIHDTWTAPARDARFHDLVATLDMLFQRTLAQPLRNQTLSKGRFSYGLEKFLGEASLARIGKVNPEAAALFEIEQEIFYAEIDLELLFKGTNNNIVYQEISKFPEVKRDLSLVIDRNITFDEIFEVASSVNRQLIKSITVFDVYEGKPLEAGKKAYALTFKLEDKEKTLTDKVIDSTMSKLMTKFESELGAIIRK